MAITAGSLIEIALVGKCYSQVTMNVWQYRVDAYPTTVAAGAIGEAWWNHVKTLYRGVPTTAHTEMFQTVKVRELDSLTGDYGEFAIPGADAAGTRAPSTPGDALTPFVALGVRLGVATRVTRPGQKRFAGFCEADIQGPQFTSSVTTAANLLMALMRADMTLGAPAALTTLDPVIVRKDLTGLPVVSQPITSHIVNLYVTTQNTRKFGRGS